MTSAPLYLLQNLVQGTVLRRYKRFLVDVEIPGQGVVTAHCPNTGTMATCWAPGDAVLLRASSSATRKLPYTWVACQRESSWVGIDTGIPNRVVAEVVKRGELPGLGELELVKTEVPYGTERSRIDVWARERGGRTVFVEVKNTTLRQGSHACFPDAVTERGQKHLRELLQVAARGELAVLVFFIHRDDVEAFDVAREVDPAYAAALEQATEGGVQVLPLQAAIGVEAQEDGRWVAAWTIRRLLPWNSRK